MVIDTAATASPTLAAKLSRAVATAKAGDPLAPVTVVCPTWYSAVSARRTLALAGIVTGTGVANVSCTTVGGLVSQLAAPGLARRRMRRAAPAVEAEVLRAVAAEAGDPWATVAGHLGSLTALACAHDELRRSDEATIEALASQPGRAGGPARLLLTVRGRLHDCGLADVLDLRSEALAVARLGAGLDRLGPLVLLELPATRPSEAALLRVLEQLAGAVEVPVDDGATCTELRPCVDQAEEARAAVRAVLAGAEAGIPLWRHAVLHPPAPAYTRLVHQELAAAGIAVWGPAPRPLEGSAAGRGLLGLLALCTGDLPRRDVLSWLASAPVSAGPRGGQPPAGRWNTVSAEAGVVRGLDQWRTRLRRLAAGDEDRRPDAVALSSFVEELAGRLVAPSGEWRAWAEWATGLLDHYLPADDRWPVAEQAARDEVRHAVSELAQLDAVSAGAELAGFRRTLQGVLRGGAPDLDGPAAGGVGDGVFVAPFDHGRGLGFDTVVLVGMAGGAGPDTPELFADLKAALGTGEARRILTFPRLHPGTGRKQASSRFAASVVAGNTHTHPVGSFASSLGASEPALAGFELTQRALQAVHRSGGEVADSAAARADPVLALGIEAIRARAGRLFTRFDGRLPAGAVTPFDEARPVSATRLETFAGCPRRFLFERVLQLRARTMPESRWRIEARARGSLVHAILERHVLARLAGAPPSLDQLLSIADELLDEVAAGGIVGRSLLWRLDRAAIVRDLHLFHGEEGDTEPLAAEFAFGTGGDGVAPPVVLALPGGRTMAFQGVADRVDRAADGGLIVSDYKTGRQTGVARLTTDPLAGGRHLQLPLYALAARDRFGSSVPVRARYLMVSGERSVACYHLELTPEVESHFRQVVERIARGIDSGAFAAVPGPPRNGGFENCRSCDFDRVCPPTRDRQWATKRADPALAVVNERGTDVPASVSGAVVRGPVDDRGGR